MKKIFFLLLLPVTSMAQKNSSHNDDSGKHIPNISDTANTCISKLDSIMPVMNAGQMKVEWPYKIGAIIYPNIEDMYKWDCEWNRAMKGITISY